MRNNIYDKISSLAPVNKESNLTACVDAGKEASHFAPADSIAPLPMRPVEKSVIDSPVGQRKGSLTVIGLHENKTKKARWVCRCDCGVYTVRYSASLNNQMNNNDACGWCRHKAFLQGNKNLNSIEERLEYAADGAKSNITNCLKGFEKKYTEMTGGRGSKEYKSIRLSFLNSIREVIAEIETKEG